VAQSGTPINGQNFSTAHIADPPPNNKLGLYQVAGGWFNAVQYQAIATGDLNAADWRITQSATEAGTQTLQVGRQTIIRNVNINDPSDNPDAGAISTGSMFGTLNIDWLDNPGQAFAARYDGKAARVVHADLKFSFAAALWIGQNQICSVTWGFTLKF